MDGREDGLGERRFVDHAAAFGHAEGAPEQRLRRRGAETNDYSRFEQRDLRLKPGQARSDLARVRRLVNSSLRPRVLGPFEVLHRVRDVYVFTIDPRGVEG